WYAWSAASCMGSSCWNTPEGLGCLWILMRRFAACWSRSSSICIGMEQAKKASHDPVHLVHESRRSPCQKRRRVVKEKTVVETRDSRWIAGSELVFVAAWVVGLVVTAPPAASAPTATVIAYHQAPMEIATLQSHLISGLTGAALVFAAALRS